MLQKEHIPNLLTIGRVLAVPAALLLMAGHAGPWPLLLLFLAAALTDLLDGYLARKWNVISPLGTMLDPIADKLLVALMLFYLAIVTGLALLPIALILLREIYISGLREFLALRNVALPVSKGGKLKTAAQMIAIIVLYSSVALKLPVLWDPGILLLWFSAILAVWTAGQYTRDAWPNLK